MIDDKLKIKIVYLIALGTDRPLKVILDGFEEKSPFHELHRAASYGSSFMMTPTLDDMLKEIMEFVRKHLT